MSDSEADELTDLARYFLRPGNTTQRQYEALRAYFVEALPSQEVARRFGYTAGSFRVLCHQFRAQPDRAFFLPPAKGPKSAPKTDPVRDQVIALRKQNLSIYDITRVLAQGGCSLSAATIAQMLKAEGFARLPRRRDDERPEHPHAKPEQNQKQCCKRREARAHDRLDPPQRQPVRTACEGASPQSCSSR